MTNFIPIFPLGVVIYPGEQLNLHIFEPRYKQMITDCHAQQKLFGIPTVMEKKVNELGTLMRITEISKVYENGEMDIKTEGVKVFRILEVVKSIPDKLYSGAIVTYPDNEEGRGRPDLMRMVITGIRELHRLLKLSKEFKKPDELLNVYDVAHHAGLSLEEEYELLGLMTEMQRQEYLKRHLQKVIPVITEMEQLKDRVKLNGHFKNLSSLDLEL
ncbi:LON peptidase substrate-binding domain-containing protein [Flavihumibacter rivuli]|uniref:LON peptidase substrate-binding domain-containing protein n=1 Tax=Flavihumibacter rivuli TaxID=2838156 RepID=UPI001BDEE62E|nr:LON peptidase substrate-binding domain-containing protein [Flavihumibacter rivuli]ULQ55389.1 LON peptidase substrate-binding domain-containing protein [Flavihumibacter rivuli]